MTLREEDLEDVRQARPVALLDLWGIDDRLDRMEDAVNRLEKIVEALVELYRSERVKNWELILQGMLKEQDKKKGNWNGNRSG